MFDAIGVAVPVDVPASEKMRHVGNPVSILALWRFGNNVGKVSVADNRRDVEGAHGTREAEMVGAKVHVPRF